MSLGGPLIEFFYTKIVHILQRLVLLSTRIAENTSLIKRALSYPIRHRIPYYRYPNGCTHTSLYSDIE